MKKICLALTCILLITAAACFAGCKKDEGLMPYVSELRAEIYSCDSQDYNIKAFYGFKESPFVNDGNVGEKVYTLTFRMTGEEISEAERTVYLTYKGAEYKAAFALNPVSGALVATAEIENFNLKEFSALIISGSERHTANFKSVLPKNTIDCPAALKFFQTHQSALAQSYCDENGNFNAEIYARVLVKEDKAYWYLGFANGNNRVKALLVDGVTGDVLAVRDVL